MDPCSRRFTWNIISVNIVRVAWLCFMDEADLIDSIHVSCVMVNCFVALLAYS